MDRTVGNPDRVVRLLVGAGAFAVSGVLGFSGAGGIVLLVVAAVLLLTAATGFCPAYSLLGVDTLRHDGTGGRHFGPFHQHRLV